MAGTTVDDRLMDRRDLYVGGRWTPGASGSRVTVISPSTEDPAGSVPLATTGDIDRAVAAARDAFDNGPWPRMTPAERADALTRIADCLRKREVEIAAVTVEEMGCAVSQAAQAQTGFTAALFDYYAGLARTFEFSRAVTAGPRRAGLVDLEPVGVVAVIVPWNAPAGRRPRRWRQDAPS
jgi:acyl-CoA reductase-like NAD-dependent aldehyde dehydrogenase